MRELQGCSNWWGGGGGGGGALGADHPKFGKPHPTYQLCAIASIRYDHRCGFDFHSPHS